MFDIGGINFANGVYHNGMINGAEVAIMESSEKADKIISDFEKQFRAGTDPNFTLRKIMDDRNYRDSDFTDMDIVRINRKVEEIYKAVNRQKGYF